MKLLALILLIVLPHSFAEAGYYNFSIFASGDFNSDGVDDLVGAVAFGSKILLQDGQTDALTVIGSVPKGVSLSNAAIVVGNFGDDEKLDFAIVSGVGNSDTNRVGIKKIIYLNRENGAFERADERPVWVDAK